MFTDQFHTALAEFSGKFDPHRCKFLSFFDQICHKFPVIQIFIVQRIGINICISGYTKQGFFFYLIPLEYFWNVVEDQFFRQHIRIASRQVDQPFKYTASTRYNPQAFFSALGGQDNHRIDFFIFQEWEWLSFSHNGR